MNYPYQMHIEIRVEVDGRVDAPLSGGGRPRKRLGTKDGTEKNIGR